VARAALPQLTGHIEVLPRSRFRAAAGAAKCASTVAATCWGATLYNAADDPYDLIDPVDILSKIPKNFFELVEEKKWTLRKEALDALLPLSPDFQ